MRSDGGRGWGLAALLVGAADGGPGRHDGRVQGRQGRAGQEEGGCTRIVGGRNGLAGITALLEGDKASQTVWGGRRAAENGDLRLLERAGLVWGEGRCGGSRRT